MNAKALADAVPGCLDSNDTDRALLGLGADRPFARVPMIESLGGARPPDIVGLAIHLVVMAMIRRGGSADARPYIDAVAASFDWGHRYYVRATDFSDLVDPHPSLWVPGICASIAEKDWAGAVTAILAFEDATRAYADGELPRDAMTTTLIGHPRAADYGPFRYDRRWVADRQAEVLEAIHLDISLEESWNFYQRFVENALAIGEPARALPLIERVGLDFVEVGDTRGGHFQFEALCVLAGLGRDDEAFAAAEQLVRHGYGQRWRFDPARAAEMPWTQKSRQNEWLEGLAATPRYQTFLDERVRPKPLTFEDPTETALASAREDTWAGKGRKRCWLSRQLIAHGDPVVRVRRLYAHASDGGFDIAAKAAFDASGWELARRAFAADRVPLAHLFPHPGRLFRRPWHTPAIAAFHDDVGRNAAAFDLGRAVALVADHAPNPVRREWTRGKYDYAPAFEPRVADVGHGDAVNFTWRLLKAGYAADLFERCDALDRARADKVFAMLAAFDRADCRTAASAHFDLPELPAMMARAFSERPTLDDHLAMADFAAAQPRWRAGLVAAFEAYALHLYSNMQPGADWFLEGLEHFTRARGCQLLYFLIHHPEDDEVLATMIEKRWLPGGVGLGGYDAYDNTSHFYYRAAVMNRMLHAPEDLGFWLESDWLAHYTDMAKDRETRRLVAQYRKARAAKGRKAR